MYNFSSLVSLKVLYIASFRLKFEYESVAWNNVTLAGSNKLKNIQKKFANVCYNRFILPNSLCNSVLYYLHFKTLHSRRQHLDALFLTVVLLWILLVSEYPLSKLGTFLH
jgi:hypothetical protein